MKIFEKYKNDPLIIADILAAYSFGLSVGKDNPNERTLKNQISMFMANRECAVTSDINMEKMQEVVKGYKFD